MTPTQAIPISAVPAQVVNVTLSNQSVTLTIRQQRTGLFLTAAVNGVIVRAGVLCHDRVALIRASYLGFPGDLAFVDTQGTSDPDYTGLGSRFILVWGAS